MTPEQRQVMLDRQSPEARKDMLQTLKMNPMQLDNGNYDVANVEAYLMGNYGFTAAKEGRHFIPTPKGQKLK